MSEALIGNSDILDRSLPLVPSLLRDWDLWLPFRVSLNWSSSPFEMELLWAKGATMKPNGRPLSSSTFLVDGDLVVTGWRIVIALVCLCRRRLLSWKHWSERLINLWFIEKEGKGRKEGRLSYYKKTCNRIDSLTHSLTHYTHSLIFLRSSYRTFVCTSR